MDPNNSDGALKMINEIIDDSGKNNFLNVFKKTNENYTKSNDTTDCEENNEIELDSALTRNAKNVNDEITYENKQNSIDANSSVKSFLTSTNSNKKKKTRMQIKSPIKNDRNIIQIVNSSSVNECSKLDETNILMEKEFDVTESKNTLSKSCTKGNRELYILRKTHDESKVLSEYMNVIPHKRQQKNNTKSHESDESIRSKSCEKDNKSSELTEQIEASIKKKKSRKMIPLKTGDEIVNTKIRTRSSSRSGYGVQSKAEEDSLESWKSCKKLSRSCHNIYKEFKIENVSNNGSPLPCNSIDWFAEESLNKRTMRSQNQDFVQKQKNFLNRVNHESNDGTDLSDCETTVNESIVGGKTAISTNNLFIIEKSWETPNKVDSDGFCWKCHTCGEELVFCSRCPKSFHFKCLKYHSIKTENWVCSECTTLENFIKQNHKFGKNALSQDHLNQLLQFAINRVKQSKGYENFVDTPSSNDCPDYKKYITHSVTLNTLEENISNKVFKTSEEFYIETKWISHNALSYFGSSSKLASIAKNLVKIFRQETNEIETCYECYFNANNRKDWFVEICSKPHIIVWAKLKGFPYWPAKAMQFNPPSMVNVRFFGEHDRSNVSIKEVYLYSRENPNPQTKQGKNSKNSIAECIKEVEIYIEKIIKKFGQFNYAKLKTPYNPMEDQLELMIPGINEYLKKKAKSQLNQNQQHNKPEIKTYKIVKRAEDNLSFIVKTNSEVNSTSTIKNQFRNGIAVKSSNLENTNQLKLPFTLYTANNNGASTSGNTSLHSLEPIKKNQDDAKKQSSHRNVKNIKEVKNNSEKQRCFESKDDLVESYEVVSKNPSDDIKKIQSLVIKRRYDGNSSSSSESIVTAENKRPKTLEENSILNVSNNCESFNEILNDVNINEVTEQASNLKRKKSEDGSDKTVPIKLQKIITDNFPPPLVLLNRMESNSVISNNDKIIDNKLDNTNSKKNQAIIKRFNKKPRPINNLLEKGKSVRALVMTENSESEQLISPVNVKNKKGPYDLKEKSSSTIKTSAESNLIIQKQRNLPKSTENAYFPIPFVIKQEVDDEAEISENILINNSPDQQNKRGEQQSSSNIRTLNQNDQNEQDLRYNLGTAVNKVQIPYVQVKIEPFSAEEISDRSDQPKPIQRLSVRDLSSLQPVSADQMKTKETRTKEKEYQRAKKSFPNKPSLQSSETNLNNMVCIPNSGVLLHGPSQTTKFQTSMAATNTQHRSTFVCNTNHQTITSTSRNNSTSNANPQPQNILLYQNEPSTNSINTGGDSDLITSSSFNTTLITPPVTDLNSSSPPKLMPRPKISFNSPSVSVFPTEAGPVCQKLMENAHIMTDFFRSLIENTLADIGDNDNLLEAKVKMLELKLEKQKYHYGKELNQIRQTMEKEKNEIRKQCEIERIKAIEETKKKQWCALCGKEAHFYCCWNTSYCDYSCQQKHWPRHMNNCKQPNSSSNSISNRTDVEITPYTNKDKNLSRTKNKDSSNISTITQQNQVMAPRIITPTTFARQPITQKIRTQNNLIPRFNIPVPLHTSNQPFSIQVLDGNWGLVNTQNSTGNILNPLNYQPARIAASLSDGISGLIIPSESNNSNIAPISPCIVRNPI